MTPRQKRPELNPLIYRLLINKMPMRRICETAGIGPQTLYTKLEFIAQRSRDFLAERERPLISGHKLPPLLLSTDRQDYLINWGTSVDRRNVRVHGVGTADNRSSYVLGMHLDYDSSLDPGDVEMLALECGDYQLEPAFRRFARVWLKGDWNSTVTQQRRRYNIARKRGIPVAELADEQPSLRWDDDDSKLPGRGMKVKDEYTMFAHLMLIEKLVRGSPHIALYMDRDPSLRSAAHVAFADRLRRREVDTFLMSIDKSLTIDAKGATVAAAKQRVARFAEQHGIGILDAAKRMLELDFEKRGFIDRWQERWIDHPNPDQSEPRKALQHLSDYPEMSNERRALLHVWGNMHGIDRYFMILRRRLSLLERPISSASSTGRVYQGNNPYRPWVVEALLELMRVAYNYHLPGKDKKTPAQRLGLSDTSFSLEEILGQG